MTSKHDIEWLDTIINVPQVCGGNLEDNNKALNKIKKDIDILEILKPHLINAGIGKYDDVSDYELLHLKLTLSGKEYNTIKKWLEND